LLLKIKYSFVIVCILMTSLMYTVVYFITSCTWNWIPTSIAIILKAYMHFFIYKKIKYKDDGRDFVLPSEFVTIHIGFSVLYQWVTYMMYYIVFLYY